MNRGNSWVRMTLAATAVTIFCNGCAVVSSYQTNVQAPKEKGVSYYLPKKDAIVTLTIGDEKPTPTFTVTSTEAYPDIKHRFLARYHRSWIGNDTLTIGVNSKGLLNSKTSADFQSQLPTIMSNIAKAVAMFPGAVPPADEMERECKCKAKGSYSELFSLDKKLDTNGNGYDSNTRSWKFTAGCGYSVEIVHLGEPITEGTGGLGSVSKCHEAEHCTGYTGFFYRQLEPYLVTIRGREKCEQPSVEAVIFSPSNAPLELLPVERGIFATAKATFDFEDGSLKSYEQTKASEISAITALPADLAKPYFEAVGSMFKLRSEATTNEVGYQKAIADLMLQQEKTRACRAALAAKDAAAIEASCK